MAKKLSKKQSINPQNHQLTAFLNTTFSYTSIPHIQQFLNINHQQLIQLSDNQTYQEYQQSQQNTLQNVQQKSIILNSDHQQYLPFSQTSYHLPQGINYNKSSKNYIYYLINGQLDLEKIQQTYQHSIKYIQKPKQQQKHIQKIQVKQNTYFTLINYKNIKNKEKYKAICRSNTSYIIRIEINSSYNFQWYKDKYQKINLLAQVFLSIKDQLMKTTRFKQFAKLFKPEKYRRGNTLIKQGVKNEKLIIIKNGQCQFSKICQVQNQSGNNSRVINNKPKIIQQNYENNQSQSVVSKQVYKQKKKIKVALAERPTILSCQHFIFQDEKMMKIIKSLQHQINGYQIFDNSINNYTVTACSAYVQTLQISISALSKHISNQWLKTLIKNGVRFYITLLRQSEQTIKRSVHHLEEIQLKKQVDKQLIKARMNSTFFDSKIKSATIQVNSPSIDVVKRSQMHRYDDMQQNKIANTRNENLSKKIKVVLSSDLSNNQINTNKKIQRNFKQRIQNLLKEKLQINQIKKRNGINEKDSEKLDNQLVKDLQDIFMIDNGYRSQSIKRHYGILSMKEELLKRRYSNYENRLVIDEEQYDSRNKVIRNNLIRKGVYVIQKPNEINYLKGLNINSLTQSIKVKYSQKINNVNKIKQQFMKIKSQCQTCHCYDNIDNFYSTKNTSSQMKITRIGTGWRTSDLRKSCHSAGKQVEEQPLQKVHNKVKFLSEKTKMKYNHKQHLQKKMKRASSVNERKFTSPIY